MSPKKSVKPARKKSTPVLVDPPAAAPARPKVNLVDLARRSLELREQHAKKVDGIGRPIVKKPTVATHYMIRFDDGTVLYADGELADVLFRYVQECEQLCATQGLAYYEGPGMEKLTTDELRTRLDALR